MLFLVQHTPFEKEPALVPGMEVGIYQLGKKFGEHVIMDCEAAEEKNAWRVRLRSLLWPQETMELYFTPDPSSEDWLLVLESEKSSTTPGEKKSRMLIRPLETS